MSIAAGLLDERVTLQQRATGLDALGQESGAWQDVATVWARVRTLKGRDLVAGGSEHATYDVVVRLRYRTDVAAGMRLLWAGQPLEIVGNPVPVDGGREALDVFCSAGIRDGRPA